MINYSKVTEDFNEAPDFINIEKLNKLISNNNFKPATETSSTLITSRIKLDEMITLGKIKGSRDTGIVRKVLHAPTLKLYIIKEEPI